jgi:lysophospholipase L1-like esterase
VDLARAQQVPLQDMLPALKRASLAGEGGFRDAIHPNAAGNARMAAAVAEAIPQQVSAWGLTTNASVQR